MKNKWFRGFALMAIMMASIASRAQNPAYTCSISNAKIVSAREYEFDVILNRTGNTPFHLSFFQLGILINPALITAGATIIISPVEGSSSLPKEMQPGPERFSFDSKFNCIRIAPVAPKTPNSFAEIGNSENGTILFRVRVTCSANFNKGISTNHSFNFSKVTGYETIIFARIGSSLPNNTNITNKDFFVKSAKSAFDITY